jgi:predicted nucleotidyltransferase component of viral defense system
MLNKEKHRVVMGEILREIYLCPELASQLGFKGGTCAYFFYELPRFSIDLNFDFLGDADYDFRLIHERIEQILRRHGTIKESYIKRHTIFALLSYGDGEHNIKIEISTRHKINNLRQYYEMKDYAGISVLAAKKDYSFAMKLIALTQRRVMVMRDVYDIYFFAKNLWDINENIIMLMSGKELKAYLDDCIAAIDGIRDNQILERLGELLDEQGKDWVRKNLKNEALFLIKNYQAAIKQ